MNKQPDRQFHFNAEVGEFFSAFHGRPETSIYLVDDEAAKLFARLGPDDIHYAADPSRGRYRGFAALHDLCDANMLLPGVEDYTTEDAYIDFCNAVMDCVTELIIATW